MTNLELVNEAREFMEMAHTGQTRWDGRPYKVHPSKVVEILLSFGINDEVLLCSGYLHDVPEDTKYTVTDIENKFGPVIAKIVAELTYPPKCTDEQYWAHTKELSPQARLIKTADILANLTDTGHKSAHFIARRLRALQIMWQPEITT